MKASASVFAKQQAAASSAAKSKAAPKASGGAPKAGAAAAAAKAGGAASSGRGSYGGAGAAKAKPVARQRSQSRPHPVEAAEDEAEDDGGVVTCANRDLLRKMLQGAVGDDGPVPAAEQDDGDDDGVAAFSLSSRIPVGSPKAGTQRRSVPTLSAGPGRISAAPVMIGAPGVRPGSPPTLSVGVGAVRPRSPQVPTLSAPGAAVPASPAGRSATGAPVITTGPPQIATGPPQIASSASQARPVSRGGVPQAPIVSQVRPASRGGVGVKTGPPGMNPGRSAGGSGYARIHAAPKGAVSPAAAKPAPKPRCGPQAFDMLRRMDQAPRQVPHQTPVDGAPCDTTGNLAAGKTQLPAETEWRAEQEHDDDGADGFLMPDSDSDGGGKPQPAPLAAPPQQRGAPVVQAKAPGAISSVRKNSVSAPAVDSGRTESAADYVCVILLLPSVAVVSLRLLLLAHIRRRMLN
eukprot:TRINITY_DN10234_c0_g1_i2.p1 TRINITY_DN10234_c0_g1~~TRINITY_DN10234_c0_g1_i2.p1  ORF type:complete len:462 (-),score=79.52 TRINITY_DN10234_c0_g1_i2:1234-2619(-)